MREFELNAAERGVLLQAVRCIDRAGALAAVLAETGLTTTTAFGSVKLNPLVPELRSTEVELARLLVALRIPVGGIQDDTGEGGSQRRSLRGVYQLGAA
jgi:hypothetical protein